MTKKWKTEISLEIEEAVTIRAQRAVVAECRQCQMRVRMVALNEAAMIARSSAREVYRGMENGQFHFVEDGNGLLFVCVASLHKRR
jgi:hypothetical protein